jgi:hypothetical protein
MATKKQRRRRAKDKRHEWETVYVDDEGNEVEVDEPEPRSREPRADRKPAAKGSLRSGGRAGRTPQPPSWRRSAKRTLIVAPIFFAFLLVVEKEVPTAFVVAALYSALFVPFSYGIDTMSYRMQLRRATRDR